MDAAMLGALGTIVVGLVATVGALIGKRGENRANQSGAVLTGYGSLVDNLQEERDQLKAEIAEKNRELAAAYAELARERADKTDLQHQISVLEGEIARLLGRIALLEGAP